MFIFIKCNMIHFIKGLVDDTYISISSENIDSHRIATRDFQQCDILTSVDSDEPVQPPFKLSKLQMMFSQ